MKYSTAYKDTGLWSPQRKRYYCRYLTNIASYIFEKWQKLCRIKSSSWRSITRDMAYLSHKLDLVPRTGIEPVTYSLEGCRSIRLSYRGISAITITV